jgi:hypothetical protein
MILRSLSSRTRRERLECFRLKPLYSIAKQLKAFTSFWGRTGSRGALDAVTNIANNVLTGMLIISSLINLTAYIYI